MQFQDSCLFQLVYSWFNASWIKLAKLYVMQLNNPEMLVINSLPLKETSSLAGSAGSFTLADPRIELVDPSALKRIRRGKHYIITFTHRSIILKFYCILYPPFTKCFYFIHLKQV